MSDSHQHGKRKSTKGLASRSGSSLQKVKINGFKSMASFSKVWIALIWPKGSLSSRLLLPYLLSRIHANADSG
jgi:hypothetical protein